MGQRADYLHAFFAAGFGAVDHHFGSLLAPYAAVRPMADRGVVGVVTETTAGNDSVKVQRSSSMLREAIRTPSHWTRRAALGGAGGAVAALGLGMVSRDAHVAAQDATPAAMAVHPIVGAWVVDRTPNDPSEIPTFNVFTVDGGLVDPSLGGAGVWAATGPNTADFTLTGAIAPLGAYFVARGSITVDAGGGTASNTYSSTIVAADGTILDQLTETNSTGRYVRIRVEPRSAVGQPLAGFPAWTPTSAATPTT